VSVLTAKYNDYISAVNPSADLVFPVTSDVLFNLDERRTASSDVDESAVRDSNSEVQVVGMCLY
jgi:hypothetical protein